MKGKKSFFLPVYRIKESRKAESMARQRKRMGEEREGIGEVFGITG